MIFLIYRVSPQCSICRPAGAWGNWFVDVLLYAAPLGLRVGQDAYEYVCRLHGAPIGIQSNMPTTSSLGYITISLDFPADACACAGHGHDGVIFKDDAGGVATADASLV